MRTPLGLKMGYQLPYLQIRLPLNPRLDNRLDFTIWDTNEARINRHRSRNKASVYPAVHRRPGDSKTFADIGNTANLNHGKPLVMKRPAIIRALPYTCFRRKCRVLPLKVGQEG